MKDKIIIHKDPYAYCAHPSMAILGNGDWLAAFNHTRRRAKIMHPGDDLLCRSRDRGRTWEAPWFAPDFDWYGTNCPGVTCLSDGRVLVAEFRFAWYPLGLAKKRLTAGERIAINIERQVWRTEFDEGDWGRTVNPWARGIRGSYLHISDDGAETFERSVEMDCSPYAAGTTRTGVTKLSDGRLIFAMCEVLCSGEERNVFVVTSSDRGDTWSAPVLMDENSGNAFSEPCLLETAPGEILCVLRHSPEQRLYTSSSSDGGATWSRPTPTGMQGLPGHVIKLSDGRLVCAYGRREPPYGIYACLSEDHGRTWLTDHEIAVRDDLDNGDLGYPTTIEYEPGQLFMCYYCREADGITCIHVSYLRV